MFEALEALEMRMDGAVVSGAWFLVYAARLVAPLLLVVIAIMTLRVLRARVERPQESLRVAGARTAIAPRVRSAFRSHFDDPGDEGDAGAGVGSRLRPPPDDLSGGVARELPTESLDGPN
jgi:hypothetical protein